MLTYRPKTVKVPISLFLLVVKKWLQKIYRVFFKLVLWGFVMSIGAVLLFRWVPLPFTPFMLLQCIKQIGDDKRELRLKKEWVPLEKISPHLQLAVVCAEDQNFLRHWGFDLQAIEKAIEHNKTHKRKRGASTISQQTAKNVFLYDGRNWLRKGMEAYFTFLIEIFWSKERILEVYLNVVEFGDGIYGAEAAARHFFQISAAKLSRSQSALLAAVLPAPRRFSVKNPSAYVRKRQQWIMQQMNNLGGELNFQKEKENKR